MAAALADTGADAVELAEGLRSLLDVLAPDPSSAADALLRDRLEAAVTALQPPTVPREATRRRQVAKAIRGTLKALSADDDGPDRATRDRLNQAADLLDGTTGESSSG